MKDFMIIGHRGACYYKPENTLSSFKYALKLKCKFLECDVHLTKDKKVVIIHDRTLDRTTNGKGSVSKYTLKELKKFNAGNNEKIPTLQELINLAKNKAKLVIELKKGNGITEKILQIIKKNKIQDNVIIVSFHSSYIKKIKKHNPKIKTALLSIRPLLIIERAKLCNADLIGIYYRFLNKKLIDKIHKHNLKIFAYEGVKENLNKNKIKKLIKLGLDGMALNNPIL
ncbi:MAG: glycerophosphodiester phosphodiesterase family protein [Nanoarchaeota archaeon]